MIVWGIQSIKHYQMSLRLVLNIKFGIINLKVFPNTVILTVSVLPHTKIAGRFLTFAKIRQTLKLFYAAWFAGSIWSLKLWFTPALTKTANGMHENKLEGGTFFANFCMRPDAKIHDKTATNHQRLVLFFLPNSRL